MTALYIILSLFLVVAIVLSIVKIKRVKKFKHDNQLIVHYWGNNNIYLRRNEVPLFEALTRHEKRRFVAKFNSDVKKGKFIKVYEKAKLIGYVKSDDYGK
tara:strand:+ start:8177 stop:8476 length:300 start_codon:yes stop_codon:yes gene_type:complete